LIRFGTAAARWALLVTVLGSGMGFLDATVVNVALPRIGRDLGASVSDLQWVLDGYLITLGALMLTGGALGDLRGRRRVFVFGVSWFCAASALCAAAPSVGVLIGARALQGVGAALVTPGSLAILESVFARADRARAIGTWAGLAGVAAALGPVVGGVLVTAISWRAVFVINVPLGAIVVVAALRHIPETRDPEASGRLDAGGAALGIVALGAVAFALIEAPSRGVASPGVLAAIAAGALAAAGFLVREHRAREPMLPLAIFTSRQFTAANLVTFVVYAAMGAMRFLLVVFLQVSLGYTPLGAGAASLPVTALMLVLSSRASTLAQRIGARVPLTVGPLLLAGGMALMTRIDPGSSYLEAVLPAVVVFGLGLSLTVAPVTATALAGAEDRHAGAASGVNNAVARVATLLAIAVLPVAAGISGADFRDGQALVGGFHTAMLIAAALAAAGALFALGGLPARALGPADGDNVPRRAGGGGPTERAGAVGARR
jgi:EmrB/QacA subfamily drug resistance transporter